MSWVGDYRVNKFKFVGLPIMTAILFGMLSLILNALTYRESLGRLDIVVQIEILLLSIACIFLSVERR